MEEPVAAYLVRKATTVRLNKLIALCALLVMSLMKTKLSVSPVKRAISHQMPVQVALNVLQIPIVTNLTARIKVSVSVVLMMKF